MSHVTFPPEVLEYILSRLPVKSLLQFRSVSKPWCALTDNPYFVDLHMQRFMETNKLLAFWGGFGFPNSLHLLHMDSHPTAVELEIPFETTAFPQVLGSCNGLICLSNGLDDRLILLWNPSTRKYKLIPRSIYEPLGDEDTITYDQVGYDHVNDDYKVVRLSHFTSSSMIFRLIVYSLDLDTWQSVEQDFPSTFLPVSCYGQGAFVNGAVHWLVNQIPVPDMDYLIYAFHLVSQNFHMVLQPEYSNNFTTTDLGKLGGCLCVICSHEMNDVDVWVMGEYGVKESWSKLVAPTLTDVLRWVYPSIKPIMYLKNGREVLLEVDRQWLLIYDIEEKASKEMWIGDVSLMSTFVYQESLVPLIRNEQVV